MGTAMDRADMGTKGSAVRVRAGGRTYLIERQGDLMHARSVSARWSARCAGRGHVLGQQEATFSKKVGSR